MIQHCVFCSFKPDVSVQDRLTTVSSFSALLPEIDGLVSFDAGPNLDFEQKSGDYSHGFVVVFEGREALTHYDQHPLHQKLGAELVAKCQGGADGILVFDLDI